MMKELSAIRPDGSDRIFSRVCWQGKSAIKIEPASGEHGLKEAWSFYWLGKHLYSKGVPVPAIYEFHESTGMLVVEDFGHLMLYDVVKEFKEKRQEGSMFALYGKVLDVLLLMQLAGGKALRPEWCWQGPVYDSKLAYEKEVIYFLEAFVRDYMAHEPQEGMEEELKGLASKVEEFTCDRFFLHRDFQSRNIMVKPDGNIGIVDFQAGRFGPLGYDLASLLNDPYVRLDYDLRRSLLEAYLEKLVGLGCIDEAQELKRQWPSLSALRLMQALGAYGFLTRKKGKVFFKTFIAPALNDLFKVLTENFNKELPITTDVCHRLISALK